MSGQECFGAWGHRQALDRLLNILYHIFNIRRETVAVKALMRKERVT
jgi:hypothetical protein